MTSALVSSSSCASTTAVCSRRPFHRKSSGIKTTKRYAQKILSRFAIFSFSFSSRFPANRLTDGANFLSLFYSLISIHRRISITPRAENEGDSASATTPAASAAPKLVPSNAASIKVNERIRLEKFCFFCFSRSKSFFFFLCLSLSGEIVSLSLSSSRDIQQSDDKSPTNVVIFCVGSISAFSCVRFCAFRQKEKENIILKNFCSLFLSLLLFKKYRSSESAAAARTR
jgi:hypothetical protein